MSNQNKAIQATIGGKVDNENTNLLDKFFEIPAYQRLYEWESTQIEELLNDIKKAYNEGKGQYFIGNITTSIDKDDSNKFVLIDGQQRLTTLWFIGFYLASKGCGEWKTFITQGDKLRIAMPIRDKEKEVLENLAKKIQKSEIKPNKEKKLELSKDLQGIHQKIIDAFGYIESWFNENFSKDDNKKEIDSERLNCFANFIYTKICFVFVELAPKTDLNRFFVRMNNRGKQLENHEILKARILDKIKDDKNWQKYAKIWDLCSDMNKYIFQSASDRNILNSENDGDGKWDIDTIISEYNERSAKGAQNDDTPDKVESIIDFPTFLLHCYKLFIVDKLLWNEKGKYAENEILEILKETTITKDKLLEIMWENKNSDKKEIFCNDFIFNNKDDKKARTNCEDFIKYMLYYRVLFDYFVIKNNTEQGNGFRIRRLQSYTSGKNKTPYYRLPEDSKSVADSPLHNLAMIQNYLRVARQGDRQNYHHWLTPFLIYLDSEKICKQICKDCICKDNFGEIAELFKTDTAESFDKTKMITFLENLDTNLAIAQLSGDEKFIVRRNK